MSESTETTVKNMPSWRIGRIERYANKPEGEFVAGWRLTGDAYYSRFDDLYFHTKEEAERYLAAEKERVEREVAEGVCDNRKYADRLVVGPWEESCDVSRLNTLLSEDNSAGEEKRREMDEKMEWFGQIEISWSCIGHTRAHWQTEADAAWLAKNRPDWKLEVHESCLWATK